MKCYYYAAAVTSHFVTHTHTHTHLQIMVFIHVCTVLRLNVPTFQEKRTASTLVVTELVLAFSTFFRMENLTTTNPQEGLHFIKNRRESLTIYTQSYVRNCFLGGSP